MQAFFKSEPWIRDVLKRTESVDLAIISIGQVSQQATLKKLGYLSSEDITELQSLEAVGDILSQFFTGDGSVIKSKFQSRVMGLPIEKLRDEGKTVIGVAGGMDKLAAIKGALNGGFLNVLVTDEKVAEELE